MKLIWSTSDFVIGHLSVPGFPLLLREDGRIERIAHLFLVETLLEDARAISRATWKFVGYALYDFFAFLESARREWNEPKVLGRPSVIAAYRSELSKRAKRSTISGRLSVLVRLYQFAKKNRLIADVPITYREVQDNGRGRNEGDKAKRSVEQSPRVDGVRLPKKRKLLKVLSAHECERFLRGIRNKTHHLMAQLQLATGIRVDELVSLPASRIVDPRTAPKVLALFVVELDPSEMRTKGSVARSIHVPRQLMALLWAYKSVERVLRLNGVTNPPGALFITDRGAEYLTRSVWSICRSASGAVGRHVHPHMLRHTYATHTLRCLSSKMNTGNALLYVRNRLGHESVTSTEIYLHYVDDLVVSVMDAYQQELVSLAQIEDIA